MPLSQAQSPVIPPLRPSRRLGGAWAAGAGVAGLLGLVLAGEAQPGPALLTAAFVASVGVYLVRREARLDRLNLEPRPASGRSTSRDEPRPPPVARAVEQLDDPLMIVAAQEPDDVIARRIVYANAAARELLRIPSDGALLVHALRYPEVLSAVERSLFAGETSAAAYETGGAQSRAWRAWSAPVDAGAEGPLRHAVLVLRDETDVRRNQRMSADFLANASHELRTPLASLSGFIETLRGHAKDDAAARDRFLGIMAAQAERMGRLIADLLSLSRIELNEHVPPSGEADLTAVARDVADALSPQARARKVSIDISAPGERAMVEGERDQIVQVVQNLMDNALKYSPDGARVSVVVDSGLTAEAAAQPQRPGAASLALLTPDRAPDRRYTAIRVSDSGPGIPREALPRLTERFYRVEGQKSGDRSGTGLGLAIVKHVVNRHRGGLAVESTAGEGTTVCAFLPEAVGIRRRTEPRSAEPPGRVAA